jgi:hypothetical protein
MLASFWTGVGDKLADRWVAAILFPAFLFWGGGLVAAGQVDYLATRFGERTGTEQARSWGLGPRGVFGWR